MRQIRVLALAACVAAALAGCRQPASTETAPTTPAPDATSTANDDAALDKAVDAFIAGYFQHNPVFAASAGKHEYDGGLPDYSPAGLKATADWLHAQRQTFAAFFSRSRLIRSAIFPRGDDALCAIVSAESTKFESQPSTGLIAQP